MDASNAESIGNAAAHDEPYRFGRRPTVRSTFPFTEREYARLVLVRCRIQATLSRDDQA